MNFKVLSRSNPEFAKCKNCGEVGSLKKYRSRGFIDKLAKIFFFRTYFCRNCQWRGKFLTYKLSKHWFRTLLFYIIIMGLTIILVYYYLENFI
jgi:hypothetical protein